MPSQLKQSKLSWAILIGAVCIIALQLTWLYSAYQWNQKQILTELKSALEEAYQKEQTYRIPVVDVINSGAVTIQSCGSEDIMIVRECPVPDTIVFSNTSGYSIENFINLVFTDLREHIVPMNIFCLADLFGGMLQDKNILADFIIERFDTETHEVLDSSILAKKENKQNEESATIIALKISEKESVRAVLFLKSKTVWERISSVLIFTICLAIVSLFCFFLLHYFLQKRQKETEVPRFDEIPIQEKIFTIGQYIYDPAKNELCGFDKSIQLNKKENAILYALCENYGNVVGRTTLLNENWGINGMIYSRSLDTYIATLRKYLKDDSDVQIITIKGVGYKLVGK